MIYGDERRELMRSVEQFCEREINPFVAQWEDGGLLPARSLFKKLGEAGLLGINKPVAVGGLGLDYTYQTAFCEALGASRCAAVTLAVGVQTDMATPALARHGSDFVKAEFLRPTVAGDFVACLGVSEVGAGSDIASVKTAARKDGDDYIIRGGKMWITNATQADWICLLCNTSDGDPHLNKSLICVPLKTQGVTVGPALQKLGMHASDTAPIFFDDVRVPQRNRIGGEGRGLFYQMQAFQEERLWVATCGLVSMERVVTETIAYARRRSVYGRPLIDNQAIHFRMAELSTKIELLRSLIYRTVEEHVAGRDITRLASMAKLSAGRMQRELTDCCLQYFGGTGFLHETEVARYYRDCRLTSIGGGADEVMLMLICRMMGILPTEAASR
jgi:citronellyl-CoA dehydrogenase